MGELLQDPFSWAASGLCAHTSSFSVNSHAQKAEGSSVSAPLCCHRNVSFWEWPPFCGVQIGKHSETNKQIYWNWEEMTPRSVCVNTAVSILVHSIIICSTLATTCSEKDKNREQKLVWRCLWLIFLIYCQFTHGKVTLISQSWRNDVKTRESIWTWAIRAAFVRPHALIVADVLRFPCGLTCAGSGNCPDLSLE